MLPWLSDTLPGAIAIDLEGSTADTNQFSADITVDDHDRVTATWTTGMAINGTAVTRFVTYQVLGRLTDGTYVLRVSINTGGSGIFPSLLLVSFKTDSEIDDGIVRPRLSLWRRGAFTLGSGYRGDIDIAGQSITLTPAPNGDASWRVDIACQL
ncbi:MAG: hypothetical protein ACFBSG_15145 [Leptolyngbyaceae cyanobacterium]